MRIDQIPERLLCPACLARGWKRPGVEPVDGKMLCMAHFMFCEPDDPRFVRRHGWPVYEGSVSVLPEAA